MAIQVWTEQERQLAANLVAQGVSREEFRREMNGRTKEAYQAHLRYLKNPWRSRSRARSEGELVNHVPSPSVIVPEECIADAMARASAPRSITAWICKDPPPGWSALDKKRAETIHGAASLLSVSAQAEEMAV